MPPDARFGSLLVANARDVGIVPLGGFTGVCGAECHDGEWERPRAVWVAFLVGDSAMIAERANVEGHGNIAIWEQCNACHDTMFAELADMA